VWTAEYHKFLVELAHSKRVWSASHGTVTLMWDSIADAVTARLRAVGGTVTATGRSCREKFEALCREAKVKQQSASQRSGDSESWDELEQLLFECNDEQAAHAASSREAKEKEEQTALYRTSRQSELKEDTMRTLSQRQRKGREKMRTSAASSSATRPEDAVAVDLTEERNSEEPEDSETSSSEPRKRRRRMDMRAVLKDSMELQREHFTKQEAAVEEQLAMQRQHLAAVDEYNKTIDKHMSQSNSLFAQMINKM